MSISDSANESKSLTDLDHSVKTLLQESRKAIVTDPGSSARLAEEALALAQSAKLELAVAASLDALGRSQHMLGEYSQAKASHQRAKSIYMRNHNKAGYVMSLKQLGDIAAEEGDYKHAMSTVLTCKNLYAQLGDTVGIADCYNAMGFIEHSWSNFDLALNHYLTGLRLLDTSGKDELIAELQHNIGVVHAAQKNFDEAIKSITISLNIGKRNNDLHQQAACHTDIGSCLNRLGKFAEALSHQVKALAIFRKMKGKRQIAVTLRALGATYNSLADHPRALAHLEEARQIRVEIGDKWGIADIDLMCGEIYAETGDAAAAHKAYTSAHTQATELGTRITVLKTLRGLANLAEMEGDFQTAVTHLKEYLDLREEIYNEEKHKHLAELNVKYETEKKDQQLLQAQKLEAIGTLAGGIAHDFNNILFTILGYTEIALERNAKAGMDTSDLEEILKAGQRAKDLIHQILAFSRKTEPALVPTDVVGLLNEVYQLINTTFPSAIEIKMDLKIDKAMVIADPSRLHQVIMNLCTNARQAMLATGGQLKLSLDCSRLSEQVSGSIGLTDASEYVVLEVSDSGSGIPENLLDRIFEPFFTTKQDSDGTGLGLSVVHGLVTEMGGTINVYSEPEVGTTFTVYLPFTDITESPNVSTTARTTGGQERILVIDDEPAIADMIKRTLDSIGYQVTVFTDPRSALAMLTDRHSDFDLVITDMSMPEVRGDVVASEISLINRDLPVIVCTGYDESLTAERRNELGIRDVLIKPASREELCQSIRNVLGH